MIILKALYFALPMYLANIAPIAVRRLNFLNQPIDGGKKFNGQPIFGQNKTWRGFVFAVLFASIVIFIQRWLAMTFSFWKEMSLYDYSQTSYWIFGILMGIGAMVGDAVKSFFKRQLKRPPGSAWFPFDQIDFILGGLLFTGIIYWPGWKVFLILLFLTPILHKLTNVVAFKLGFKEVPW